MKKLIIIVLVLAVAGAGAWAYWLRRKAPEPTVQTQAITRGDVVETVGATGTLEAVETVDVGTQVSGVVQQLYADFNSIVKKGQVIAKLDPQLILTQIEQQSANVTRAEADLERLRVALEDSKQKLERARAMAEKNLIPRTELETAEVNVKSAEAQIRASEAALSQARAQLNNQKVNLGYTTITAPIDGIVISRNVDQGQTVAASMNAPTLYVLAADLTKMQVLANIDEADVGRMRPGQHVTFRVDAYPTDTFTGTVSQVRLQPAVVQNVVTYSTVISVPNPDLKLKPGMTANVTIEIARRNNVLRVPNRALAFRPTAEMFAALNQPVPAELERGRGFAGGFGGRGGGNAASGSQPGNDRGGAPGSRESAAQRGSQQASGDARGDRRAQPAPDTSDGPSAGPRAGAPGTGNGAPAMGQGGRGGFDPNLSPEERQRRREERLKAMTPEQRAALEQRMREGGGRFGRQGGGGWSGGDGARAGGDSSGRQAGAQNRGGNAAAGGTSRLLSSDATTIDALFAPIQITERPGMAWLYQGGQMKPLRLRLGVSDSTYTEIINEQDVQEGAEVVVNFTTGQDQQRVQPGQGPQNNPLMGPQRGRGGGGGRGRG